MLEQNPNQPSISPVSPFTRVLENPLAFPRKFVGCKTEQSRANGCLCSASKSWVIPLKPLGLLKWMRVCSTEHCNIYLVPSENFHGSSPVGCEVWSALWYLRDDSCSCLHIVWGCVNWFQVQYRVYGGSLMLTSVRQYRRNSSRLSACTSYSSQVIIRLIICDLSNLISLININSGHQRRAFTYKTWWQNLGNHSLKYRLHLKLS